MNQVNPVVFERYSRLYKRKPQSRIFAPLADLYRKKGNLQKAMDIGQKGIKEHPYFAFGHVVFGMTLLDLNKSDCAIKSLETAVQLAPGNLLAHKLLGKLWWKKGNPVKTLAAYKMILFLDPENQKAHNIVQKLEGMTATKYDDSGFAFKSVKSIAQYLNPVADDVEQHPVIQSLSASDSQREQKQFLARYSMVEALIYRKDFSRAKQFIEEMKSIYGTRIELEKKIQNLAKKLSKEDPFAAGEKEFVQNSVVSPEPVESPVQKASSSVASVESSVQEASLSAAPVESSVQEASLSAASVESSVQKASLSAAPVESSVQKASSSVAPVESPVQETDNIIALSSSVNPSHPRQNRIQKLRLLLQRVENRLTEIHQ